MLDKIKKLFKNSVFFALCAAVVIAATIVMVKEKSATANDKEPMVLTLWQIDSFEGGRGSRATTLQNIGEKFSKKTGCYLSVTTLTADAARMNIERGTVPDLISYGAGTYGLENLIGGRTPYYTWCYGGYCLLSIDSNCDFTDASAENTVINSGTGNFVKAAAMFVGLDKSAYDKPTGAYVKLINGEYKYLLGTQRDIFRLKTRGVAFSVKPITEFNDLFQNISITTADGKKISALENYISFLLENCDVSKVGLLSAGKKLYDDEMSVMEGLNYNFKITAPISKTMRDEIESAILNSDENKLKTLLK